jgi:hypothetical protein
MEPEGSLLHSQVPTTFPYPKQSILLGTGLADNKANIYSPLLHKNILFIDYARQK